MRVFRWLITICSLCVLVNAQAATVNGVRVWRAPDHTRIVLDLDSPVTHTLTVASNPERIILDVSNTHLKASLVDLPLADTPVMAVRSYQQNNTDLRLVMDLRAQVKPSSFSLKAHAEMHDRLVIDLYDINSASGSLADDLPVATSLSPTETAARAQPQLPLPANTTVPVPMELSGNRNIVIAIDAGHGGEDPGALGPNRLREKEVTLAIAKELLAAVNAQPGFVGKLTRTGDYFIPLKKRRDLARTMKADLFVSIHADAFTKPSARGASVFALSRHGATSETARFLAQRENESDLIGGVGDISLDDKDQVLAGVLVDLSMTATLNSSLQIGHSVLSSMGKMAHLHKSKVEQAGFMVLKSPDVPSILVETGFISNKEESRKLATAAYRKQMAQSVFKGIQQHFNQHPPPGTLLAAQRQPGGVRSVSLNSSGQDTASQHNALSVQMNEQSYIVVSGDTYTSIARRHGVGVKDLMRYNSARDSKVRLGQTIKIPVNATTMNLVQTNSLPVYTPAQVQEHKVKAGDTLSRIARLYGVSVADLLRHNNLKSSTVKVGQTLSIPTS